MYSPDGKHARGYDVPLSAQRHKTPYQPRVGRAAQSAFPERRNPRFLDTDQSLDMSRGRGLDMFHEERSELIDEFEEEKYALVPHDTSNFSSGALTQFDGIEQHTFVDYAVMDMTSQVANRHAEILESPWKQIRGDEGDRKMLVDDHFHLAKRVYGDLKRVARERIRVSEGLEHQLNTIQMERDTWLLLAHLEAFRERLQIRTSNPEIAAEGQGFWSDLFWAALSSNEFKRPGLTLEDLAEKITNLMRNETVLRWLEEVGRIDEGKAKVAEVEVDFKHTKHEGKHKELHLDPDTALRASGSTQRNRTPGTKIHGDDLREITLLIKTVWSKIRMGQLDHAQEACRKFRQAYVAAMLEGLRVWEYVDDAQSMAEQIVDRAAWRRNCRKLANRLNQGLIETDDKHEVALFALLGGNISPAVEIYPRWADRCWAQFTQHVHQQCDDLLYALLEQSEGIFLPLGLQWKDCKPPTVASNVSQKAAFYKIRNLGESDVEDIRFEADGPFRTIQKLLICQASTSELERKLAEYVLAIAHERRNSAIEEVLTALGPSLASLPSTIHTSPTDFYRRSIDQDFFLRFCVHLYLGLNVRLTQKENQDRESVSTEGILITSVFVGHLIQARRYDLVPRYVRYMPDNIQRRLYNIFLNALGPKEAAHHLKKITTTYDFFTPEVVLKIKKAHVESRLESLGSEGEEKALTSVAATVDDNKIDALDCYDRRDKKALIDHANRLFREFARGKRDASACKLSQYLINKKNLKPEEDLEMNDWSDYVCLLDWYTTLKTYLRAKPKLPPVDRKGIDPIQVEEKMGEINAKLRKWHKDCDSHLEKYLKNFRDLACRRERRWLTQGGKLRDCAMVHLVFQVIEVCENVPAPRGLRCALDVVSLVADEDFGLYASFVRENQMHKLLLRAREVYISYSDYKHKITAIAR